MNFNDSSIVQGGTWFGMWLELLGFGAKPRLKVDELVKSLKCTKYVIPAKAGIQ